MGDPTNPRVAVIVPAYNEESRIANVLWAAQQSRFADEIVVVSDGSTDGTATVAKRFNGVQVLEFPTNRGKGAAMSAGVRATKADIVVFLDADLIGLRGEHVDVIVRPLMANLCDMCIGIFRGGKFWSDTAQKFAPTISGQRAMRRSLFLGVPHMDELRMGVEVSINAYVKQKKARVQRVILRGVANSHKEQKLGLVEGSKARLQMYGEMVLARTRFRTKRDRPKWGASTVVLKKRAPKKPKTPKNRRKP
jgi:glycosyltransferase involved in cell wall biosynthesis